MEWTEDDALVFRPETRRDIANLMQYLLAASPEQKITFSTDYQFGGERQECGEVTLDEFFRLHDSHALRYNRIWHLKSNG